MAVSKGFGAVRKLPSGKFQAKYLHPSKPYTHDGKRNYITAPTTFRTKTAATAWLSGIQADIERGIWKSPEALEAEAVKEKLEAQRDRLTFGTYARRWLESRNLTPATFSAYESYLRVHLEPRWADVPLKAITTSDIRLWLSALAPNAPGARKKASELFRTILNSATDDDLISHNPYKRNMLSTVKAPVPTRKIQYRETRALEYAQLEALALEVPEYLRVPVLLSGYCGLRSGEMRELRGKDVEVVAEGNIARVYLNISRAVTGQGRGLTVGPPKTASSIRTVPVPAELAVEIVGLAEVAGSNGLLFHPQNDKSRHIPQRTYQQNVKNAAERLGLGHVAPHDFRRTMVTEWQSMGVPLADIQAMVGHATASMTMRYARSSRARLDGAVDRLDAILRNRERPATVTSLDEHRAVNE